MKFTQLGSLLLSYIRHDVEYFLIVLVVHLVCMYILCCLLRTKSRRAFQVYAGALQRNSLQGSEENPIGASTITRVIRYENNGSRAASTTGLV